MSSATRFANSAEPVRELISFRLDEDRVWRVSGYSLRGYRVRRVPAGRGACRPPDQFQTPGGGASGGSTWPSTSANPPSSPTRYRAR